MVLLENSEFVKIVLECRSRWQRHFAKDQEGRTLEFMPLAVASGQCGPQLHFCIWFLACGDLCMPDQLVGEFRHLQQAASRGIRRLVLPPVGEARGRGEDAGCKICDKLVSMILKEIDLDNMRYAFYT